MGKTDKLRKKKLINDVSREKIYGRFKRWLDEGNRGITATFIEDHFPVSAKQARWLLTKFYEECGDEMQLCRGFQVVLEAPKPMTPYKPVKRKDDVELVDCLGMEYDAGFFATEAELLELEETDDVYEAFIYCVHPKNMDNSDLFGLPEFDVAKTVMNEEDRFPLTKFYPGEDRSGLDRLATEAKKKKEAAKIDALFAAAGTRTKHVSPKGKKNQSPVRPAKDFFKSSPNKKKKDEPKAEPATKNTIARNLVMDDVFTTGEDEPDFQVDESVNDQNKPPLFDSRPPAKAVKSKSKKTLEQSQEIPIDVDEEIDEPGPSEPRKMKRMQKVTDTYMVEGDDEGDFIKTEVTNKMVESNEPAPPPVKKQKAPIQTKPDKSKEKKAQSSILSFFQKK